MFTAERVHSHGSSSGSSSGVHCMRSLVGDDGQRMLPAALSDEDAALLTQRFPFLDQLRRVPSRKKEEEKEGRRGGRRKKEEEDKE